MDMLVNDDLGDLGIANTTSDLKVEKNEAQDQGLTAWEKKLSKLEKK